MLIFSHPNVCTESGDYMRAGYYKLLITSLMPKEICRRCANAGAVCVPRPPSKHFGSGINALSICEDSETGCLALKYIPQSGIIYIQVNSLTPAQEPGAATLQPCAHTMMVDGDPQPSGKCPRLHDMPHMTTPRKREMTSTLLGLCLFNMLMETDR